MNEATMVELVTTVLQLIFAIGKYAIAKDANKNEAEKQMISAIDKLAAIKNRTSEIRDNYQSALDKMRARNKK
jgi:hypothetical protein